MASWSTKGAISLKRVKIQENFLWRAYRKSQKLFRTAHASPTPYGLSFPKIGGSQPQLPHPKTAIAIISGTARPKATDCKFGRYIQRVHPNIRQWKILEIKRAWAYPGTAQMFWVPPIISRTGKATIFKFGTCIHSQRPSKQKPLKIWEKLERTWAYRGTAQIFWVPPIISGTGKAANFKCCTHIRSPIVGSIGTKAH